MISGAVELCFWCLVGCVSGKKILQNMSVIGTSYKIGKLSLEEIDPQFEGGSASADS